MIAGLAAKIPLTSVKFSYRSACNPLAKIAPVISEPPREKVAIWPEGVIPKKPGKMTCSSESILILSRLR